MAQTFVPGTLSVFQIGATPQAAESVDFNGKITTDDVTHTLAQGWQVIIGVINSTTVKVAGGYDTSAHYHANPPNIVPGAILSSVTVSPDGAKIYVTSYLVVEFNWKGGPKAGAVRFDATLQSTGTMTYPTN